jgi:prepilin-type N-terminal cleavage/methylation domain-containing protein
MRVIAKSRCAFTLVEMVVVLVVLGLALAVVGPAMMLPQRHPDADRVIELSRAIAIRRAEHVEVAIDSTGRWAVRAPRSADNAIQSGQIASSDARALKIDISPLGLCSMDDQSTRALSIDAFSCSVTSGRTR